MATATELGGCSSIYQQMTNAPQPTARMSTRAAGARRHRPSVTLPAGSAEHAAAVPQDMGAGAPLALGQLQQGRWPPPAASLAPVLSGRAVAVLRNAAEQGSNAGLGSTQYTRNDSLPCSLRSKPPRALTSSVLMSWSGS